MGIEGPDHARLSAHPGPRACGRRRLRRGGRGCCSTSIKTMARFLIRRWHLSRRGGAVHRHRHRRGAGRSRWSTACCSAASSPAPTGCSSRRTPPRGEGIAQPQRARKIRQPSVFRRVGHAGIPGPQLRRDRPARRRADPDQRQARQGTDPGLRRPADRRHRRSPDGGAAQRTRAHRRLRSQGAGDRPDHRHRMGQPGRCPVAGDDVQRRHRAGRHRSIRICPAGFRSSATSRSRWIPAGC